MKRKFVRYILPNSLYPKKWVRSFLSHWQQAMPPKSAITCWLVCTIRKISSTLYTLPHNQLQTVLTDKTKTSWTFTPDGIETPWNRIPNLLRYSLRAGLSGDRIPVGGTRFSAPVQTGHGAHPASYTKGTGSSQGIKRPGRGIDHPPPYNAEVRERVELYLYSTPGPSWPVVGWTFYF